MDTPRPPTAEPKPTPHEAAGSVDAPAGQPLGSQAPSSTRHARVEFVSNVYVPPGQPDKARPRSSSALWVPLKASQSKAQRLVQMVAPSGWALLMAAVLFVWRPLALFALRGHLDAGRTEWVIAACGDVGLALCATSLLRLMAAIDRPRIELNADVVRNGSLMLAGVWWLATLLRVAGLVAAAIDKRPIDAAFFAPLLGSPGAWVASGPLWAALVVAVALGFLARYCLSCDMETAQALTSAEPHPRFLALTVASLVLGVALAYGSYARARDLPATSVARLPEVVALDALAQALHDPSLRQVED